MEFTFESYNSDEIFNNESYQEYLARLLADEEEPTFSQQALSVFTIVPDEEYAQE